MPIKTLINCNNNFFILYSNVMSWFIWHSVRRKNKNMFIVFLLIELDTYTVFISLYYFFCLTVYNCMNYQLF